MPEGDTIHRTAHRLSAALTGEALTGFEAARLSGPGPAVGTIIDGIEAQGKFLLVHFGDGLLLETHMKMTGSWHLYRPGERWRRSTRAARVVLRTEPWVGVCFDAPHVALLTERSRRSERNRGHLGPDLCGPDPDLNEVARLVDDPAHAHRSVADVVLDQRLFCGVGNVFKSEVLHACGVHPSTELERLDQQHRRRLIETAHIQLRANLAPGPRRTVPEGLAVYGRTGLPCRQCGSLILGAALGTHQRRTYWCPSCQPAA